MELTLAVLAGLHLTLGPELGIEPHLALIEGLHFRVCTYRVDKVCTCKKLLFHVIVTVTVKSYSVNREIAMASNRHKFGFELC